MQGALRAAAHITSALSQAPTSRKVAHRGGKKNFKIQSNFLEEITLAKRF